MMDVPIYMLFEGRRFWPGRARRFMQKCENERLKGILERANENTAEKDIGRYLEAVAEKKNFPIYEDSGDEYVEYPTQLGNCISSFKSYPDVKYGISAVFFWNRLWVKLDSNLRKELDNLQAIADSGLYLAFSLYVLAAMIVIYSIGEILLGIDFPYISSNYAWVWLWIPVIGLAYGIYRIDIFVQMQFGDMFKAIFDMYRGELSFEDVSDAIDRFIRYPEEGLGQMKEKNRKVWRYLQWHKVRPPGKDENYTMGDWCRKKKEDSEL